MIESQRAKPSSHFRGSAGAVGSQRWLLAGFASLVLALVGAFAYEGLHSQAQSRRQAEQRFDGEAALTAQLTDSLFTSSLTASETAAAKTFGARVVSPGAAGAVAKKSGLEYLLILDQQGKVIAASPGSPASVLTRSTPAQAHVRAALAGHASLSGILPVVKPGKGELMEWALPFQTRFGRRVEIEGLNPTPVFTFLSGFLTKSQSAGNGAAFVLDHENRLVGATGTTFKVGDKPKSSALLAALATKTHGTYGYGGAEHYFASTPVAGSSWRVVLSVKTSSLYPALAGSESWFLFVELTAFAIAGAASLLFFRAALRSGSRLARTNAQLTAMNATLEERVAERTAAAEERARELARSNDELEQFSSVASHDLQEPLRKIRMFGDRLRERLGDNLAEEPAADLARMGNAAERMQRLINDLLDYSRVTHRGREFEPVDLSKITEEVVADLEARVVELDARIEIGELPVIEGDRTQMRQLIQNLVGNALKFHREGEAPIVRIGGEVIFGQRPRFPGESVAESRCVLTVEDNGIGFDAKHSERVFTAFERLHSRTSYEGTGIGLSIARKIVWRHGGHITAVSEPGKGATFTVTLPLSQPNSKQASNGVTDRLEARDEAA